MAITGPGKIQRLDPLPSVHPWFRLAGVPRCYRGTSGTAAVKAIRVRNPSDPAMRYTIIGAVIGGGPSAGAAKTGRTKNSRLTASWSFAVAQTQGRPQLVASAAVIVNAKVNYCTDAALGTVTSAKVLRDA
jgi:hypothetical protein